MLRRLLVLPLLAGLLGLTALASPAPAQEAPPPAEPVWAPLVRAEAAQAIDGIPERFQAAYSRWAIASWWARLGELVRADEARKAEAAAQARAAARTSRSSRSSASSPTPSTGGHDPCAGGVNPDGLLPDYIVQRESHGQCDAYNHGGCGGRGCLGWAQIDEGHFSADSPWGSGPGSCYGLSYNGCVAKLSAGGTNLAPWRCC